MKNLTLFPLASNKNKLVGVIISILSMLLMALASKFDHFILFKRFDNLQHYQLFFWFLLFGLFSIAFSKEKLDDERIQKIRGKSFQVAFGILVGGLISLNFVGIITPSLSISSSQDLSLIAAIPLFIYLFFFHISMYFDPAWVYNDETALINIKKNKLFFLIYTFIVIITAVIIYIL